MANPALKLELGEYLCYSIYAASHAFNRVYKPLLDRLNLTYPQYLVMVALWEQDDQTVGSLGAKLALDSNTLTPLLKRIESVGYIRRTRDAVDERQVKIRLTDAGQALRAEAASIPACVLEASGLSIEDHRRLQEQIAALRNTLESYAAGAAKSNHNRVGEGVAAPVLPRHRMRRSASGGSSS